MTGQTVKYSLHEFDGSQTVELNPGSCAVKQLRVLVCLAILPADGVIDGSTVGVVCPQRRISTNISRKVPRVLVSRTKLTCNVKPVMLDTLGYSMTNKMTPLETVYND